MSALSDLIHVFLLSFLYFSPSFSVTLLFFYLRVSMIAPSKLHSFPLHLLSLHRQNNKSTHIHIHLHLHLHTSTASTVDRSPAYSLNDIYSECSFFFVYLCRDFNCATRTNRAMLTLALSSARSYLFTIAKCHLTRNIETTNMRRCT